MSTQPKSMVEFTKDAERALQERVSAFGEELRLAAIEEAVRSRGTAAEVTSSDVLRAAASALPAESLSAYSNKLERLSKLLEEQSLKSQTMNREIAERLRNEIVHLAGYLGEKSEQQQTLLDIYRNYQEQTYASTAEMRSALMKELETLRVSLTEQSHRKRKKLEQFLMLYVAAGAFTGLIGIALSLYQTGSPYGLISLAGFLLAAVSALMLYWRYFVSR